MNAPGIAEITSLMRRHRQLLERIETLQYAIGSPSGIRYDKLNIQSSPANKMESAIIQLDALIRKAVALEAQIEAKLAVFRDMQERTGKYTNDEWKVLNLRYFANMQYSQIEEETGYSYRKIRRLVGRIKNKSRS